MPMTTCNHCGAPAFMTESDRDHGAEVYCSPGCAAAKASDPLPHTPGPWSREDGDSWIVEAGGIPICTMYEPGDFPCWDGPEGQLKSELGANLRLATAAPDMLAACEAAIDFLDEKGYGGDVYGALYRAVVKATGRSDK